MIAGGAFGRMARMSNVSRRRFLALAGAGMGAAALSGCSFTHAAERTEAAAPFP